MAATVDFADTNIDPKRKIITDIIASANGNAIKVHKFSKPDPNTKEPTFDGVIFFKNSIVDGKTHTQLYFENNWTKNDEIEIGEETIEKNAYFDFRTVTENETFEDRKDDRDKEISLAANAISTISDLKGRDKYYNNNNNKLRLIDSTTGQEKYGDEIPANTLGGSTNKTYRHIKGNERERLKRRTISSRTKLARKINLP